MIVLDASVLIAYLDADDAHYARARALLAREVEDEFGANSLTLGEVLVLPARQDRLAQARVALDALGVAELALPPGSAVTLAAIRASTRLRMPDCCVLLAAEHIDARLASFDERLAGAARSRGVATLVE